MSFFSFPLTLALSALVPGGARVDDKIPTTPRECVEEVRAYRNAEIFAIGYFDAPYMPKDEIEKKVSVRAKDCGDRFASAKVSGKQLDALAQLAVLANNDQGGRDLFSKRLAEPGITVREKALAYAAAVQSFADHNKAERIPVAEDYLKALDALPTEEAGEHAALSHMRLANTYRLIGGKMKEQVDHSEKAIVILQPRLQIERAGVWVDMVSTFGDLAEAYVSGPDSKAKIDAAADKLLNPVHKDVPFIRQAFELAVKRAHMLGREAPNVYANHWFNVKEAPANGTLVLKGSIPHLVEFTKFG